ncbi:MAG: succinyl-diaminopimelate desuccinylase [Parashewanella sp.]
MSASMRSSVIQLANSDKDFQTFADHKAVKYAQYLIRKPSVTPEDAGCQAWFAQKLQKLDFEVQCYEVEGVSNLIAHRGSCDKTFAFAGHTDVVPACESHLWQVPPFDAEIVNGELIGRGAVDMKTSLAVMLAAMEDVLDAGFQPKTSWQFLLTSDEEGEAEFGTRTIVDHLASQNRLPDYCLVGEPTSDRVSGDMVKIGRRGAISGKLFIRGKQGHVAYAGHTKNAIHIASMVVYALEQLTWDVGSDDFPGTSLQVTYINSGNFTDNIVPGRCEICFNIRYSHRYSLSDIQQRIQQLLSELDLPDAVLSQFEIQWERHCPPYFNQDNKTDSLVSKAESAIHQVTGSYPRLSTSGGTSDGRFLASEKTQILELGLPNKTIHQVNERAKLEDIHSLYQIYKAVLLQF